MNNIYLLNNDKFEGIRNLPVLKINFLKKEVNLETFDVLIFTSKNAVKAIDSLDTSWRNKEIYSIGKGTSKEIKKFHANLVYTSSNSYGDAFANEIYNKLKDKKVLFLRAKEVTSNLNTILKDLKIDLNEKILYETTCNNLDVKLQPKDNSIIIFTSPSTINCFLKTFVWLNTYKAVVIGKVTARALPAYIIPTFSEEQTINSCIDTAKKL